MPRPLASKMVSTRLTRLVEWFIPAKLADDADMSKQARVFLISHLFGPFLGNTVPLALFILDPTPGFPVAVLALSITGFWLFPFLLRFTARYNLLALASVQNLIFCILWSCYFYGGVTSPTLPWVLVIPLLAFFYLGPVPFLRGAAMALFAANVVIGCGLYIFVYAPHHDLPESSQMALGIISTVAASLYVTMMSFYYARILASQAGLESEVKQHLSTAAELREATAAAERSDAAKSEFLAKTSHELRTPLNAVIGYSEMLLEEAEASKDSFGVSDLQRIRRAGKQLLSLVNDLLDLSKIAAGKMELFIEQADIGAVIEETAEQFRFQAESRGTLLHLEIAQDLGRIPCDAHKVQQIVTQLVSNAVKFTEKGAVTVRAQRVPGEIAGVLQVVVQDTGIGMSEEMMPGLFEAFNGAEDYSSSKYGGTGLGLALSQNLAVLMGGEITVRSELGNGSCFTVSLPLAGAISGICRDEAGESASRDHPLHELA
jgi:signal transduction histidine kinase